MKNTKLILIIPLVFLASCIPSLHPIFNAENRITDDRIIGNWVNSSEDLKLEDVSFTTNDDTRIDINSLELQVKDDSFVIESLGYWQFGRAANIDYKRVDDNGSSININLENQMSNQPDYSLLEKGFVVDKIEELPYYILNYKDLSNEDSEVSQMVVNLTKIEGETYMDFAPQPDIKDANRFSTNIIPAHTFAKVEFVENQLVIKTFDAGFIEELIRKKRVRLKHELIDDTIVLTASMEELRAFIAKYGKDEELYYDDEILVAI